VTSSPESSIMTLARPGPRVGRWRPTRGPGLASVVMELSGEDVTR